MIINTVSHLANDRHIVLDSGTCILTLFHRLYFEPLLLFHCELDQRLTIAMVG